MRVKVLAYREEEIGEGALLVDTMTDAGQFWCVAQVGRKYYENLIGRSIYGYFEVIFGSARAIRSSKRGSVERELSPLTGDNSRAVGYLRRREGKHQSEDDLPLWYVEASFDIFTDFEADQYRCDIEEGHWVELTGQLSFWPDDL